MDYTIETDESTVNAAGEWRVRYATDPYGINPREDFDQLGVMVAQARGYALPAEGEHGSWIGSHLRDARRGYAHCTDVHDFRVISRYLRLFCGATVVLPLYDGGGNDVRLVAGTADDEDDHSAVGLIYDTPATRKAILGEETVEPESIAAILAGEVRAYAAWAAGEMVVWVIEQRDGDEWEPIESCGGYYSVEDARESAQAEVQAVAAGELARWLDDEAEVADLRAAELGGAA